MFALLFCTKIDTTSNYVPVSRDETLMGMSENQTDVRT
jgi:hypothetical protein